MARIAGIDPSQTSFFMRLVFKKVRKMLGRDLTPQMIQARVPRLFWFSSLVEWILGKRAKVPQRQRALVTLRTAVQVGCPFRIDVNAASGRIGDLTDEENAAIREGKFDSFPPAEAALLRMADATSETP